MAVSLIGGRQQHEAPILHSFDLAFRDPEFRRIDEIVRRIDPHDAARVILSSPAEGS